MNILALDCGITTGYASLINGLVRSGIQNMKSSSNESAGMKYIRFDGWLDGFHSIGKFNLIVYEKPHGLQGNAIESMNGFITGIQRYCAMHPIEFKAYSPSQIKLSTGNKGNCKKDAIVAWFEKQTGREPDTDDESDAYALLMLVMNELSIKL